jgi:membrane protein DedA with SNARE-associated domain
VAAAGGKRTVKLFPLRLTLLVIALVALVSVPFVVWGDAYAQPLLEGQASRKTALTLISVGLLAADAVAPVPSTLVVMFLAAKAGWIAGVIGGTLGLSLGVLTAAWFGREALGRIVPRFFPEAELARLRSSLEDNLALTLACWRCVPVLAEASVMLASATQVPVSRIIRITLLPNFIIALIYSVAADDSFATAALTFGLILTASLGLWLVLRRRRAAVTNAR